jgi:hypothetical protein
MLRAELLEPAARRDRETLEAKCVIMSNILVCYVIYSQGRELIDVASLRLGPLYFGMRPTLIFPLSSSNCFPHSPLFPSS